MSKPFSVCVEVGGHDLYVHGNATKAYPETFTQSAEPPELEIVRIDLLTGMLRDSRIFLDITDLIEELGGSDLIQTLVEDAFESDEDTPNED